ncbi:hypothetical protein C789_4452 [Microcystis aeruginosa FACHB-905 = DIANCHI905]|nr:hypothetical protein C789_4452 [Microcystis aeruginosa FACHB-905 = DIANCHI905]
MSFQSTDYCLLLTETKLPTSPPPHLPTSPPPHLPISPSPQFIIHNS